MSKFDNETQLDRIEAMLQLLAPTNTAADTQRRVIEMLSYMARNQKIEAIKECRHITGIGLKEAKNLICNAMEN